MFSRGYLAFIVVGLEEFALHSGRSPCVRHLIANIPSCPAGASPFVGGFLRHAEPAKSDVVQSVCFCLCYLRSRCEKLPL